MPDANLAISPFPPDEAAIFQAIRHETFSPTINKILYTREPSQKTLDSITQKYRDDIINKNGFLMKCVDKTTGITIAGAKWRYLGLLNPDGSPAPRPLEEVKKNLEAPEPYEESDPVLFKAIFTLFGANKLEIMGTRPYYVLDTLVTHPDHHRRGAGAMLVQWGCEKADELGVEAFLEASPMGQPLYARYGFETVKEVGIDLRQYGGDEEMKFIVSPRGLVLCGNVIALTCSNR
jgi:GNAT superfamily N-acetyltransferase